MSSYALEEAREALDVAEESVEEWKRRCGRAIVRIDEARAKGWRKACEAVMIGIEGTVSDDAYNYVVKLRDQEPPE